MLSRVFQRSVCVATRCMAVASCSSADKIMDLPPLPFSRQDMPLIPLRSPGQYVPTLPVIRRPALPEIDKTPLTDPARAPTVPLRANRMIIIKRKKLKKHFRLKRYRKRWHFFMMRQRRKKERGEREFKERMNALMAEARDFDAKAYVENILTRSRWTPDAMYKPTGEKISPPWYEQMTNEDLHQLPFSRDFDPKAHLPDEEDLGEIEKRRKAYYAELAELKKNK